jgi:alpha-L-rhamnosidase
MRNAFVSAVILAACAAGQTASLKPVELKCEYRKNPAGIDIVEPRLSWQLAAVQAQARNLKQSAWRVVASATREEAAAGRGDLWDSGKVDSGQSVHVVWKGKPLESRRQVYWKVMVWDQAERASVWSEVAGFSMGLLKAEDWQAQWIGREESSVYRSADSPYQMLRMARWVWGGGGEPAKAAPKGTRWFRAGLTVPAGLALYRATAVMAADSSFELTVNGKPAGRGNMARLPEVLDLASHLRTGINTILVKATNSRGNRPAGLVAALEVESRQGETVKMQTGPLWETSESETGPWAPVMDLGPYGMAPWGEGFRGEQSLPARMLRREFTLEAAPKRAVLYVSGLGTSEVYLNGAKAGDAVLSPGLTDYDKRFFYVTHDVTKMLRAGPNAVGAWLGNGRYFAPRLEVPVAMRTFGAPRLRLQLEMEMEGGKTETVVSDMSWKLTTKGPVRSNNEFDGEVYDARAEMPGWSTAEFDDTAWEPVEMVAAPNGVAAAQMAEPLKVTETLRPVKVSAVRPGVWIFDMGQNMVGWCRLKLRGTAGTRVQLRHSETLKPDGNLYLDNLRSARATDIYTLKGGGPEVWEPRFIYHGFRYVEVTGFPGTPAADALEGRVVHDAMAPAGSWESSNDLLNKLHKNIYWGIRGNYRSIPTDCPQRDERQGWLGDRSVVSRSESYLFDVGAFYSKWHTDLVDSQRTTGSIPDVAPAYWTFYNDSVTWPGTFLLVPAMLHTQYGDTRVIAEHYDALKRWVDYMRGFIKDGLMPKDTYGDWCVPPEKPDLIHSQDPARKTDGTLIGTAYFHKMLELMAGYARMTGRTAEAAEYERLAAGMRAAFHKKFYDESKGVYGNGTQTSSILPLAFGMAPAEVREKVFSNLVGRIESESANHVGTGLVGAQWLMRTLSDNGRPDLAYRIATQTTYPGWGYMISKGATTVWELWNGDTADPAMNSGNHVMQIGDLNVWLYEYLAGIRPDPEKAGFERFLVKPQFVDGLNWVKATHRSMYGEIRAAWRREQGSIVLDVTIPPNATALVWAPGKSEPVETGSGSYTFRGK